MEMNTRFTNLLSVLPYQEAATVFNEEIIALAEYDTIPQIVLKQIPHLHGMKCAFCLVLVFKDLSANVDVFTENENGKHELKTIDIPDINELGESGMELLLKADSITHRGISNANQFEVYTRKK